MLPVSRSHHAQSSDYISFVCILEEAWPGGGVSMYLVQNVMSVGQATNSLCIAPYCWEEPSCWQLITAQSLNFVPYEQLSDFCGYVLFPRFKKKPNQKKTQTQPTCI